MSSKSKGKVLIVDDERSMREMLEIFLKREGYTVAGSANAADALAVMAGEDPFDLIISDINMPGLSGLDLLREVRSGDPGIPVIMITAYGSSDSAVEAMKLGATDYITKPFRIEEIKSRISAVIERRKLVEENVQLHRLLEEQFSFENIVGRSPGMKRMFEVIERVSPMDSTVVITGASGTGKELIARALHYHGGGRKGSFVSVNCGALVETLLESELFGHRKGAFTGADSNRQGLFETASGGTLFLDEITETSGALQVKLLRAIQEREVLPVGGTVPVKVDARIIAATNSDLAGEVKKGRFREDLYYRLNVIHIQVPALKERREDIPPPGGALFKASCREAGPDPGFCNSGIHEVSHGLRVSRQRKGAGKYRGKGSGAGGRERTDPRPAARGSSTGAGCPDLDRRDLRWGRGSGRPGGRLRGETHPVGPPEDRWQPDQGGRASGDNLPFPEVPSQEAGDGGRLRSASCQLTAC